MILSHQERNRQHPQETDLVSDHLVDVVIVDDQVNVVDQINPFPLSISQRVLVVFVRLIEIL